jgi:hypothetical protein
MVSMPKKKKPMPDIRAVTIAKEVCLKYLDAGGFADSGDTDFIESEIDENENVLLTIRVMITALDIESAAR